MVIDSAAVVTILFPDASGSDFGRTDIA